MTRDDSAWVNEFFETNSRDFTPASARRAAHVLYAPVSRDPEVTRCCASVLSDTEANAVEGPGSLKRLRTFFQFWGLKEAVLKSIGEGLPFGLDAFEFELDPTPRVVNTPLGLGGPERFSVHMIEGTGSCTAIVIRSLT